MFLKNTFNPVDWWAACNRALIPDHGRQGGNRVRLCPPYL